MTHLNRRSVIKQLAAGTLVAGTFDLLSFPLSFSNTNPLSNMNHSVCRWTYNFLSLEDLCKTVKEIGFSAIDLVGPKDWPVLKKHEIFSSMCNGAELSLT